MWCCVSRSPPLVGGGSVRSDAPVARVSSAQQELRERKEREASVADSLAELQMENSRLTAMARLREEGLSTQVGELQARSDAAHAHVAQLASSVPQATKPLLRQIGALQQQRADAHRAHALLAQPGGEDERGEVGGDTARRGARRCGEVRRDAGREMRRDAANAARCGEMQRDAARCGEMAARWREMVARGRRQTQSSSRRPCSLRPSSC